MVIDVLKKAYKFTADQLEVGIHLIDLKGQSVLLNQKMSELKGLQEALPIEVHLQNHMIYRVLKTQEVIKNYKQNYWLPDGKEVVILSDFLPIFEQEELLGAVEIAKDITAQDLLAYQPLRRYGQALKFETITAVSNAMKSVINRAKIAAQNHIPTLLYGESGTGKDMIAEGIHHELDPSTEQFVTLICRYDEEVILQKISEQMEKNSKITLFFERVEYLSIDGQKKLLALIKKNSSNNAFIASIGEDPIDLINQDKLLKELYYFFATVCIHVPPLRDRRDDIMPFILDYMKRYCENTGNHLTGISEKVKSVFMTYDWPGNLKELEVLLDDTTSIMTNDVKIIDFEMLPMYFRWKLQNHSTENNTNPTPHLTSKQEIRPLHTFLQEMEEFYLKNALELFEGNISQTAKALNISRQSLQYRLKKLNQ